jgi:uncharacterized damage-inducible protein DinB
VNQEAGASSLEMNKLDLREHFMTLVAYEKWANEQWLDYVESTLTSPSGGQFAARNDEWISHIIGCYSRWLDRMEEVQTTLSGDNRKDLDTQCKRFNQFLSQCDFMVMIQRSWPEYGTYEWRTDQVVYHALSHGAYHRGHIRGIAEELSLTNWPDTDFCDFTGTKIE